ncbi:hypothetical protein AY600_16630 [Phormidium willei BDU 130791]|nr:hypothetical protein AY600_16630 [Phormidium willei BDU 130791]
MIRWFNSAVILTIEMHALKMTKTTFISNRISILPQFVFTNVDILIPNESISSRFNPKIPKKCRIFQESKPRIIQQPRDIIFPHISIIKFNQKLIVFNCSSAINSRWYHKAI